MVNYNLVIKKNNLNKVFFLLLLTTILACKTVKKSTTTTSSTNQMQLVDKKATYSNATTNSYTTNTLLKDSNLLNAHIGICIYEPLTKQYLYKYQSDKYFVPASNVKIATCYAAMKYLGDSLVGLQYFENDTALYIQGTGDPSLLHKDFKNQHIFEWLISKKNKKIILCNNNFSEDPLGKGWAWDDFEETYMAERSEMPLYGNTVDFYYNRGYKSSPPYFEKYIKKNFEKQYEKQNFKVNRELGKNLFSIAKSNKNKNDITFNTKEIPNIFASLLSDTLHTTVNEGNSNLTNLKKYSQPTDSVLKKMMYESDNFIAEQSLLMVSNQMLGVMKDEKIIDTLLKTDLINIPQKPKWVDGCGLSRYNLFSPEAIVFILNKMKDEFSWQRITTIFPTANQGTLKGFYKKYQNKIYAKTGTLSNNTALSGFVTTKKGKQLVFSVILNNYLTSNTNAKTAIENYLSSIIENY